MDEREMKKERARGPRERERGEGFESEMKRREGFELK